MMFMTEIPNRAEEKRPTPIGAGRRTSGSQGDSAVGSELAQDDEQIVHVDLTIAVGITGT